MTHWLVLFLFAACFSLATWLHTWFLGWEGNRSSSANLLAVIMGDSRRMFANHFYVKADVYFHRGFYPSLFDNREQFEAAHAETGSGAHHAPDAEPTEPLAAAHAPAEDVPADVHPHHHDEHEHDFLSPPRDWIERLNRHFSPSIHTELSDPGPHSGKGLEREILPWLWLSAELDPHRIETYTVASYWLSERLGRIDEAEKFLRQGLRDNPHSHEILYELGRLYHVHHRDLARARNLWELGIRRWQQQEAPKPNPDRQFLARFLRGLARIEEADGNLAVAIQHLEALKPLSPLPGIVQAQIDELKARLASSLPLASRQSEPQPVSTAN